MLDACMFCYMQPSGEPGGFVELSMKWKQPYNIQPGSNSPQKATPTYTSHPPTSPPPTLSPTANKPQPTPPPSAPPSSQLPETVSETKSSKMSSKENVPASEYLVQEESKIPIVQSTTSSSSSRKPPSSAKPSKNADSVQVGLETPVPKLTNSLPPLKKVAPVPGLEGAGVGGVQNVEGSDVKVEGLNIQNPAVEAKKLGVQAIEEAGIGVNVEGTLLNVEGRNDLEGSLVSVTATELSEDADSVQEMIEEQDSAREELEEEEEEDTMFEETLTNASGNIKKPQVHVLYDFVFYADNDELSGISEHSSELLRLSELVSSPLKTSQTAGSGVGTTPPAPEAEEADVDSDTLTLSDSGPTDSKPITSAPPPKVQDKVHNSTLSHLSSLFCRPLQAFFAFLCFAVSREVCQQQHVHQCPQLHVGGRLLPGLQRLGQEHLHRVHVPEL